MTAAGSKDVADRERRGLEDGELGQARTNQETGRPLRSVDDGDRVVRGRLLDQFVRLFVPLRNHFGPNVLGFRNIVSFSSEPPYL